MAGVAVVTGASRGIGRAIAIGFAEQGSDVVGISRDARALHALGEEIERAGPRFLGVTADLSTPNGPALAAMEAWRWQNGASVLVNAAGVLIRKPEEAVDVSEWDLTFALNVRAPFLLTRELGSRMYHHGSGCVVNIASVAGEHVTGAPAPYQASKAALIQLTRFFARKLAPRIRVNAVGPGYVRTDLSREWLSIPANERWVEERTPLGRVAAPEEIARPVLFLASEAAGYVTGQHLLVDGGWSIG